MIAVADLADLWDGIEIDRRILVAAEEAPRLPLGDRLAIAGPGTYLIRYHGLHPDYGDEARGCRPIYVGSALSLARRLTEHRASMGPDFLNVDWSAAAASGPSRGARGGR